MFAAWSLQAPARLFLRTDLLLSWEIRNNFCFETTSEAEALMFNYHSTPQEQPIFSSLMLKPVNSNLGWQSSLPVYILLLPRLSALRAAWLVQTQQQQETRSLNLNLSLQAYSCFTEPSRVATRGKWLKMSRQHPSLSVLQRQFCSAQEMSFFARLLWESHTPRPSARFTEALVTLQSKNWFFTL